MKTQDIKNIVEQTIPLDPACESNRRSQITLRMRLHGFIQDMVTEYPNLFPDKPYDPRTSEPFKPDLQFKNDAIPYPYDQSK